MRRRDESHLRFIRQLPCLLCLDDTGTEAAHIRMADARIAKPITGISIKPDDRFTIPLCSRHHREQHGGGEREFWEGLGTDPILLALALYSISGDTQEATRIITEVAR